MLHVVFTHQSNKHADNPDYVILSVYCDYDGTHVIIYYLSFDVDGLLEYHYINSEFQMRNYYSLLVITSSIA
jgi:hypothetical protein